MKKYVDFSQFAEQTMQKLSHGGVFLTAKHEGRVNTMTIGWGGINYYWARPIFQAPVRHSRFTYDMIKNSGEFTVSVPLEGDDMKKQLAYCGSHSGRNEDKISACGIKLMDGEAVNVPVIGGCTLHFECKVVGEAELEGKKLSDVVDDRWYGDKDYHTLFFGEIVSCYILE